jgi:hypothetical protein
MNIIIRKKPEGILEEYSFKNYSYDSRGILFLIFNKLNGKFEEELIVGLNSEEALELKRFLGRID